MGVPREPELSDEVSGDQDGTTDFVFGLTGDPIPLLPTASSPLPLFDLHSPPVHPLAISDSHATVLLAHPDGIVSRRITESRCCPAFPSRSHHLGFVALSGFMAANTEELIHAC